MLEIELITSTTGQVSCSLNVVMVLSDKWP